MSVPAKPARTARTARPTGPRPAFRGAPAHVRVPATSANLGPGFDSFGLALGRYDDVIARIGEDGAQVDVAGEGAGDVPLGEDHLIVRSMRAAFDVLGGQPRGIDLVCANRIPHGRGLGSSSAAICAGILLARALVLGGEDLLPDSALLPLANELEGHPDNVAACLLGGMTIAWTDEGAAHAVRLAPDPSIRVLAFIPQTTSSTKAVRGLLPATVPYADAVFNTSRAALLVAALTGNPGPLLTATDDRLHQPYRASAMPESAGLVAALRSQGIAAMISGAGPSVLALAPDPATAAAALAGTPAGWESEDLAVDAAGARVILD
ncbi:MAG: thrB [Jatrophihabitantaceae bacterium]|nr:thrB [Jatrophihabitantaceae bacterium]